MSTSTQTSLIVASLMLASTVATRADAVTDWNAQTEQAMKTAALNPGVQGRFAAIVHAADTIIAGFDSEYTDNFWRPHHAIRNADLDGNPATEADPAWAGLFVAPRHQESISNHAVFTGGFMHAVGQLLGDEHTFTLSSIDFPGFSWTFNHVREVAAQAKEARIWAGIHYRNSCEVGEAAGVQIANYILAHFLRPVETEDEP